MPVKFGIPMIEGNKEDVQAVTDLASLADVLTKHKDEYGLTSENIYKLPLLYSMYPQALLEKLADNNSAAWMKADGTLDEEKIKEFLEQSERIYQAGKDAMDELKAAYPQAFDDSEQPVYERAGSISGETAVLLSRNCEFALGDIFSPLDFAFVNSMAEIDTSLAYALWNGRLQIVSFRSTESESALELPRKLLLRNSWNIYFPRKDRCFPEKMVSL